MFEIESYQTFPNPVEIRPDCFLRDWTSCNFRNATKILVICRHNNKICNLVMLFKDQDFSAAYKNHPFKRYKITAVTDEMQKRWIKNAVNLDMHKKSQNFEYAFKLYGRNKNFIK